ncbi:hypothetical protein CH260_12725 [Rhodococcus sp. 05-2256-B2]|nr:hypothetical protein CH258_18230 [Rhodococcus sp. 05-2256-B4]OZD96175.1 hypothetical protein CH260_12725 [Rhodococcus sp. 05-2256-B2]OZD96597.1 hypothetical protein CH257_04885 [Rhodococcus sp. 05-2256-B3]OZD99573.1 hypothetical protein CH285_20835 [Rhodococcus sp. 05-2256-B1]
MDHDRRHEPFKPQNTVAVKHGMWSRSDRFISVRVAELINDIRDDCDWLREPSYEAALVDWAQSEARIEQGERFLAENGGDYGDGGGIKGVANYLIRLRAHTLKVRERLGLDPLSRSKLQRDQAATQVDLASLMASTPPRGGTK